MLYQVRNLCPRQRRRFIRRNFLSFQETTYSRATFLRHLLRNLWVWQNCGRWVAATSLPTGRQKLENIWAACANPLAVRAALPWFNLLGGLTWIFYHIGVWFCSFSLLVVEDCYYIIWPFHCGFYWSHVLGYNGIISANWVVYVHIYVFFQCLS